MCQLSIVAQLDDHITRPFFLMRYRTAILSTQKATPKYNVPAIKATAKEAHQEFCKTHYRLKKMNMYV